MVVSRGPVVPPTPPQTRLTGVEAHGTAITKPTCLGMYCLAYHFTGPVTLQSKPARLSSAFATLVQAPRGFIFGTLQL